MDIKIHSLEKALTQELEVNILRKLECALSRMEPYIAAVNLRVSSKDNVKDGVNKHCQLIITTVDLEKTIINDTQSDLNFAIDRSIQRGVRLIARKAERQQMLKKHAVQPDSGEDLDQD